MASYFLLFASAFLAATIIPFYSEAVLVTLLAQGYTKIWLWVVATIGNTLGAGFNWILGCYLLHFQDHRWFPFKPNTLEKSQYWFQRYGIWSLLFSWLPIIGDAFPFIAGLMRVRWWIVILLCGIGKGIRYIGIIWLTSTVVNAL